MSVLSAKDSVDCRKCVHYYVTWDPRFPHGCKCMGFKGKHLPNAEVRSASNGMDCMAYQPKNRPMRTPVNEKGVFKIRV